MNELVPTSVLGIASTAAILLLSLGTIARTIYRGLRRFIRIHDLLEKELNNNGGSSMKDQIESANRYAQQADEAAKKAVEVASNAADRLGDIEHRAMETNALAMSHERELGALTTRIRKLEDEK